MIPRTPTPRSMFALATALAISACGDSGTEVTTNGNDDDPAEPCPAPLDVVLDPGQHQAYDGDTCLVLPSGASGDLYRVVVTRPTLISDAQDTSIVWMQVERTGSPQQATGPAPSGVQSPASPEGPRGSAGAPSSPTRDELATIDGLDAQRVARDRRILERTRRFHMELRERERDLVDLPLLASRVGGAAAALAPALADPPSGKDLFLTLSCTSSATRTPMELVDFNEDVAIYKDADADLGADPSAATGPVLDYFATHVSTFVRDYWGETPDVDGNGRIIVAAADVLPDSAAAAVFSGDFRSTADCASSNEAEIVYFSSEVIRRVGLDLSDPNQSYLALSVLAHEAKHVTSLFNSIARRRALNTTNPFHSTWIEEGTAEISQTLSSRKAWAAVGGPPVTEPLSGQDILDWNDANGGIGPEAWGVIVELGDVIAQMTGQPNSLITNPAGASEFHTFYAASWHFHRFIGDAFGNAASAPFADAPLFQEMTDSLTPSSTGALQSVTGRTFEELFEDLVVAASLHQAGPEPTRAFTTWDLTTATAIFQSPPVVAPPHRYPWPVTARGPAGPDGFWDSSASFASAIYSCPPQVVGDSYQAPAETDRCAMGPSGMRFHDFESDGAGDTQIRVFGAESGRIIVTRLN